MITELLLISLSAHNSFVSIAPQGYITRGKESRPSHVPSQAKPDIEAEWPGLTPSATSARNFC
jgi:hypothetical protein